MPANLLFSFFFNDTATTEIYTLSLHDALPIYNVPLKLDISWFARRRDRAYALHALNIKEALATPDELGQITGDRKSTRLNSSHGYISYAVFCLKKKKNTNPAGASTVGLTQACR